MKILVTGSAGFIGFHLSKSLLNDGDEILGVDNLNNYYSPALKDKRLKILQDYPNFQFSKTDISDFNSISNQRCKSKWRYLYTGYRRELTLLCY